MRVRLPPWAQILINFMITIISSTNRKNSFTKKLANTYNLLCKEFNMQSQIFDLQYLPQDFIFSCSYGRSTKEFDELLNKYFLKAEKYIFIIPEYNGTIPGILKALIDCADYKSFKSKKVSIVGVSSGRAGNIRGVDHLTSIFHHLGSEVFNINPKLSNINISYKENELIDDKYLELIKNHLNQFNEY